MRTRLWFGTTNSAGEEERVEHGGETRMPGAEYRRCAEVDTEDLFVNDFNGNEFINFTADVADDCEEQEKCDVSVSTAILEAAEAGDSELLAKVLKGLLEIRERGELSHRTSNETCPVEDDELVGETSDLPRDIGERSLNLDISHDAVRAAVNSTGHDGDTPLHLAALYGHVECVEMLLQAGADVTLRDVDGLTCLHDCAASGYQEIVSLILNHVKEVSKEQDASQLFTRFLNAVDNDGDTALHAAARGNHAKVVQILLESGSLRDIKNNANKLAVELADESNVINRFQ